MKEQSQQARRFILYHKHHASARTRFLCFAQQSVLFPQPLPALSQHYDETTAEPPASVIEPHPAMLLHELATALEINVDGLELEPDYVERVDTTDGVVRVFLVRFTAIDPPFELAQKLDAAFIDLTQARTLPATELLLLRRGYEVIMEG